jgi:5-methylcytosine-specific restriction enzyme subunit McrC
VSRPVRTVVLTERRSAVRRLARADVDDLARHFRHVVDVTPTFDRGVYRLTARGYVGSFRTATARWEVRPKLPWESLRWLAGVRSGPGGPPADYAGSVGGLADLLAGRLAELIRERSEAGLLRDYAERRALEPAVRGRIDLPRQLRGTQTPSLFHLVADEFTPDVVWNRLPKAAARRLLDHLGLGTKSRARLADAVGALEGVSDVVPSAEELDRLRFDRRSEPYRPLVSFSRLILGQSAPPGEAADAAFLINLEHLFQSHVSELLARPGAPRAGWSVESQPDVILSSAGALAPIVLRPDLLARDPQGRPASVWDVKWKSLTAAGPDAADAHQVLGYAAALGLRAAGLVYPGRRFAVGTYTSADSSITLRVVRLRLVAPPERCDRAAARLARLVARAGPCRR